MYQRFRTENADGTHVKPFGAPNGPDAGSSPSTADSNYDTGKNLYDRFYEGDTPNSDPAGLFDYSKGAYTAVTAYCALNSCLGVDGELVAATIRRR